MPMFRVARLVNACFLVIGFCLAASPLLRAQQVNYSTDRHTHAQTVAQSLTAPTAMKARLAAGEAVSVAVGDFHRVGTKDLVTGYALATGGALVEQQGAREATAPGEAEQALLSAGGTVPAFAARADVTELPVRPELMLAYDVNGDGATDLLTAQRGDSTLYYLPSDGHGGFLTAQTVALNGRISALAAWRSGTGEQLFAAAITREQGSGIELV